MAVQVAVCGPGTCDAHDRARAFRVGQLLADRGAVIVCGGGSGVMAAVAAGGRSRGGTVVGIRPDDSRAGADAHLSATVVTNMGEARNAIVAWSGDAMIAIGDSWGTLSEIALGVRRGGIPVIVLGNWRVLHPDGTSVAGPQYADSPEAAVRAALDGIAARGSGPAA